MSPALNTREIDDIGDTVLSFSEAKALATNNPLLMDKAAADTDLARLARAERAHYRTQDTLRRTIERLQRHIAEQADRARDIDLAISRRQDTRGDAFAMTVEGRRYRKRADAGQHLLRRLSEETANQLGYRQRTLGAGELGGFPLTATIGQALGEVLVTMSFDGAPGTETRLTTADLAQMEPVGLITRLENRLARLETARTQALAGTDHARGELEHAHASLGRPFPQAADLASARDRVRHIDEQLQAAAAPAAAAEQTQDRPAIAQEPEADAAGRQRQGSDARQAVHGDPASPVGRIPGSLRLASRRRRPARSRNEKRASDRSRPNRAPDPAAHRAASQGGAGTAANLISAGVPTGLRDTSSLNKITMTVASPTGRGFRSNESSRDDCPARGNPGPGAGLRQPRVAGVPLASPAARNPLHGTDSVMPPRTPGRSGGGGSATRPPTSASPPACPGRTS